MEEPTPTPPAVEEPINTPPIIIEPIPTPPVFDRALIHEPYQSYPPLDLSGLGPLEGLVGTWTNQNLPGTDKGDPDNPYSYNLIALPQVDPTSPTGYILKNFKYFEEITFSPIAGNAPNRGGTGTQVCNTLFYEQRVYFADGPAKNSLVHAENGHG
jgi:hypothetical protein